jgi:hypothetical protein
MDMLGHDDIADDHEAVTLASLFENVKEGIATARVAQKRQSPVAGTGDKVQVMSAVGAMQSAGHDKAHDIGSIAPALAKNARTGHPPLRNGKRRHGRPATRPPTVPEREAKTRKAGPPAGLIGPIFTGLLPPVGLGIR